ncbi:MAG: sel1 repeat family protein [Chlorobium sp.]|nr:sel1 repeat family protein [Chlorobium sp.]
MNNNTQHLLNYLVDILREEPHDNEWRNLLQSIRNTCDTIVEHRLLPSDYPEKLEVRSGLVHVLGRVHALLRFPQLIGRSVVCFVGCGPRDHHKFFSFLPQAPLLHRENESVPMVVSLGPAHPDACTGVVTIHGKHCHADVDQIIEAIQQIRRNHGELRSFFTAFAISHALIPENLALIDVPRNTLPGNIFLQSFLDTADMVIMPAKSTALTRDALQYLEKSRSATQIHLFPPQSDQAGALQSRYRKLDFVLESMTDLSTVSLSGNGSIRLELEAVLEGLKAWMKKEINRLSEFNTKATADIVHNEGDTTFCQLMTTMRDEATAQKKILQETARDYANDVDNLLQEGRTLEEHLQTLRDTRLQEQDIWLDALKRNNWKIAEKRFLALLDAAETAKAAQLANDMRQGDYAYSAILDLYLDKASGTALKNADLAELRHQSKGKREFIHRACIHFRFDLQLSDKEAGNLYAQNIDCHTAEEFHTLGCWKITVNPTDGEKDLRTAFRLGHEASGNVLLNLALKNENERTVRYLANALHPEASYTYGLRCLEKRNWQEANVYLRIAATAGKLEGMLAVARMAFRHLVNEDEKERNKKTALQIYRYLWHGSFTDNFVGDSLKLFQQEDLLAYGSCLYEEKSYIDAFKVLSLCNHSKAYRLIGRMYHYGDGSNIDYKKAKQYYNKSVKAGDSQAQKLLVQLERIMQEKSKRASTRSNSYSRTERTTSRSSSSDDSLCFLTTATCRVMGYEDNCDVLQAFRHYRDNILLLQEGGKNLVANYYDIAPKILKKIDAAKNSAAVYQNMWNDYIQPGYYLLLNKRYEEAKELYVNLVVLLQEKYCCKTDCRSVDP